MMNALHHSAQLKIALHSGLPPTPSHAARNSPTSPGFTGKRSLC